MRSKKMKGTYQCKSDPTREQTDKLMKMAAGGITKIRSGQAVPSGKQISCKKKS